MTYSVTFRLTSTNRKLTTRFPTNHKWTVYVTPKSRKGWHKTRFCCLCQQNSTSVKKVCYKVFLMKTSSDKVVATSLLYLTVHRRVAGDVSIYLKFGLKVTHPFRKRRFRHISLNSAAAVTVSQKRLIIANRKSTMHFPSSHRWTLCVTPKSPKLWLKTRILHVALPFISSLRGIVDTFKFGMWVEHSLLCSTHIPKSQPTNDKLSLKRALSLSHDLFNFWGTNKRQYIENGTR